MTAPRRAWIALGSNLGDRAGWLRQGADAVAALPGVRLTRRTAPIDTAPLGGLDQPPYLNAMLQVEWSGAAIDLLHACHAIEAEAGRDRQARWASRTLDLDLVCVEGELRDGPDLTLPHPGLRDRAFWAAQLAELDADD